MTQPAPNQPLHRDDPDKDDLLGNVKVTRQDWLNTALDLFIENGVDDVKILKMSETLDVSRSSFYWYFESRKHLLNALLDYWEDTNTKALIRQAETPAATITEAICNVFRGFLDPLQFNTKLDFAVRDWARRAENVKAILDRSDEMRINALAKMFERFDYKSAEALTRARTLYYMQIGYNLAELNEPMDRRLELLPFYLLGFSGKEPQDSEITAFRQFIVENGLT